MNKVRLLKLADYLDTLSTNSSHFDMGSWAFSYTPDSKIGECGSAGCALGYATNIFPELHLEWIKSKNGMYTGNITFDDSAGFLAAAKFFDLRNYESVKIFSYTNYPNPSRNITPQDVSRKIREMINE